MKSAVYVETTIPSYLTARTSRDILIAAHQQVTRDWWNIRRPAFELFVSQAVLTEAAAGDPTAAAERLLAIRDLSLLALTPAAIQLADELVRRLQIPTQSAVDGLHVALAAVHRMDYLLTWNCSHIANAALRSGIESVCAIAGYPCPVICTPLELMEVNA